jgi:hypothetical protein
VVEPSDGSFHNPSLRQHLKTRCSVRSLYDFDLQVSEDTPECRSKQRPLIATISVELAQKRIKPKQRRHDHDTTIPVLNIRPVNHGMQHQAERINKDVAFLSLDFLAAFVTRRVNRGPPFSALFTLWRSMTAALGLVRRQII